MYPNGLNDVILLQLHSRYSGLLSNVILKYVEDSNQKGITIFHQGTSKDRKDTTLARFLLYGIRIRNVYTVTIN